MVVLFSRIPLKGTIIAKLSPLAFGIYLFQTNRIFFNSVIKDAFIFITEKNLIVGIGYVCVISFAIFLTGLFVEFIRTKLASALKISKLSDVIVEGITRMMAKLFIFLR